MRVTKDGTEILLRQDFAKVKSSLELMEIANLKRLRQSPDGTTKSPTLSVVESVPGEACSLLLWEYGPFPVSGHRTGIEARRVADGLTQVRAMSVQNGLGSSSMLTGKPKFTRTPDIERQRLTELLQTAAQ